MHSIRVKITAITIAAILTSMLLVAATGYFTIKAENDTSSAETLNLLCVNVRQSLDDYLDSIEQSVEMAANIASDSLDEIALVEGGVAGKYALEHARTPEQVSRLDAYLSDYCANLQEAFSSVASYTQGVVTYYFCINPYVSEVEHGFFYSKVGKTGFDEQEPLDARTLDPEDIGHTTWYYTPIQRGRPSWVGPYTAHFLGEMLTCSYLVPIYKAGTLIGVLGMDIPFETLTDQVSGIRVYRTGFACLLDEDERVLYHPRVAYGELVAGDASFDEMFRQASSGEGLLRYTADGQDRQLAFATLSNGMKLAIVAPRSEIIAPWVRLGRVILLVGVATILVFSTILLLATGIIIHPLKRLTAASKRLAAEDYDVELSYDGKDEVGTLTRAFAQMRDHVKLYVDDLNRRIYTDAMTGLPNMRYFFKLAQRERDRMAAAGERSAVLYINLIGMKFFNRQYGFDEGDKLIREIAGILARHYGWDRLSRFGQDHFTAVTEETGLEAELEAVFEECRGANGGRSVPLRVGIYQDSLGEVDVSVACDRAKYACDQQKGIYASSYRYFDSDMLNRARDNNYIINHLDQAIAEGWIQVYYQPIVRAANGRVCDEEALARWIDPEKGLMSPGAFIPALEDAKLIYKLDLYVAEQILEKMKRQAEAGIYVVPTSVNLSRVDFEVCDIVEEIRRRVDEAGVGRDKLTIEVTESVVGSDFEKMKAQIERFQQLGFQVWMDDFGSGYSSLDVLQSVHFDVIKLDMRFMQQFDNGDKSKIILTELIRMAIGLGIETVAEGVEREEQVRFLRDVGCTKLQGFYYSQAIPAEEIFRRTLEGSMRIGFENPNEAAYYASLGRVNLYDVGTLSNADDASYEHYFDTLPMALLESDAQTTRIIRCNKSYRDFMERTFGVLMVGESVTFAQLDEGSGSAFLKGVRECGADRQVSFINEEMENGSTVHAIIRYIATNPVMGIVACAVAVLGVSDESDRGVTYTHIAQALSADYINLYYVNMETEQFSEYNPDPAHAGLVVERRGTDFFAESRKDAESAVFDADREVVVAAFTKENVAETIDRDGAFTLTYRLMVDGEPCYVNMKAVRMSASDRHIIIGVNNVDAQMKQREAMERMREEQTTYARIAALTGDFIAVYTVDPATEHYVQYSATADYEGLGLTRQGEHFFARVQEDAPRVLFSEDLSLFKSSFTRENVLREIDENGLYVLQYRLMIDGEPRYVGARVAKIEEKDGPRLIIGVNNIDAQVRREQEYVHSLSVARNKAHIDVLTGVKDRVAFADAEAEINRQIAGRQPLEYAIVAFDVVGYEAIRDAQGPAAGDDCLKRACAAICATFKHSPVYRTGEASFVAIARAQDYRGVEALCGEIAWGNRERAAAGDAVIACGFARYEGDLDVDSVLRRADVHMKADRARLEGL